MENKVETPIPIGARPRFLLEEWRAIELYDAILRYIEYSIDTNRTGDPNIENPISEWKEELYQLMDARYDEPQGLNFQYLEEAEKWGWTTTKILEIKGKHVNMEPLGLLKLSTMRNFHSEVKTGVDAEPVEDETIDDCVEGDKVTVTEESIKLGSSYDQTRANRYLKPLETYVINKIIRGDYDIRISVQREDGTHVYGIFNAVHFVKVKNNEADKV